MCILSSDWGIRIQLLTHEHSSYIFYYLSGTINFTLNVIFQFQSSTILDYNIKYRCQFLLINKAIRLEWKTKIP